MVTGPAKDAPLVPCGLPWPGGRATPKATFSSRIGDICVPVDVPQRQSSPGGAYGTPPGADIDRYRTGFLIRDRDASSPLASARPSPRSASRRFAPRSRSPRANAIAERFVPTVCNECLDHLLIVSQRHLESVLDAYVHHFNEARSHRVLQLTQPIPARLPRPTLVPLLVVTSLAASFTSTTALPDHVSL